MNVVANKYQIQEKLGKGQFGAVCKGTCLKSQKKVAIKMEHRSVAHSLMKHEATVLHYLDTQKCKNIPYLYYYGFQTPYKCIVMSYFSQGSLDIWRTYLQFEEKIDWWNTALSTIKHIHNAGIVHRDLKPQHFIRDDNHVWHLIDFGLSATYLDDSQEHIIESPKDHIVGTPNYVSWFVHKGKDVTRRDDFLSLIYLLWELLYGSYLDTMESTIENINSTDVVDEFNVWLRDQKEFHRFYTKLDAKNDNMVDFMVSVLSHAEELRFTDKPCYDLFILDI